MKKTIKKLLYYEAVGRRKRAVARVRLYIANKSKVINVEGTKIKQGEIYINKKNINDVYPSIGERKRIIFPLKLTKNDNRFAISLIVRGGGKNGWLEAIIHAISLALRKVDYKYQKELKKYHLVTRDPRKRERRKVGMGGKARRKRQSPKR